MPCHVSSPLHVERTVRIGLTCSALACSTNWPPLGLVAGVATETLQPNSYGARALPLPMHSTSGACSAYTLRDHQAGVAGQGFCGHAWAATAPRGPSVDVSERQVGLRRLGTESSPDSPLEGNRFEPLVPGR